jgi:hypothetical protein
MAKQKILLKPERIVVFELVDVVPRRNNNYPNVFVTTTNLTLEENHALTKKFQKSRRKVAKNIVKIREDLCPNGWYTDSKSRGSAKSEFCKELAIKGYCVNPSPEAKYCIYVVKLKKTAWLKDERQPVYVGESSYEPVERISQHLEGVRSARKVKHHFDSRWEELEPAGLILHSYYDAIAAETQWGVSLLNKGYKVFGPQGLPKILDKAITNLNK